MKLNLSHYKIFIFDFDGVIIDSANLKTEAYFKVINDDRFIKYHIENAGISRFEKFRYYYEKILHKEISEEELKKLCDKYSEILNKKYGAAKLIKGVKKFLNKIVNKKSSNFICSGAPYNEVVQICKKKNIQNLFKEIYTYPLTKIEIIKKIILENKIEKKKVIFFGDALNDYAAACANKVDFIGIINKENQELFHKLDFNKIKNFNEIEL